MLEDISTKKMPKNIGGSVKMLRRVSPRNKILKNKNKLNNINIFKRSLPLSMKSSGQFGPEKKIKKNKANKGNINTNLFLNDQELNIIFLY